MEHRHRMSTAFHLWRTNWSEWVHHLHMSPHPGWIHETLTSSTMEDSSDSEVIMVPSMNAHLSAGASSSSCSQNLTVTERIESSKKHWSELPDSVCGKSPSKFKKVIGAALSRMGRKFNHYRLVVENKVMFRILESDAVLGGFLCVVDEEGGEALVLGEQIAEGAQAKIFDATLEWPNMTDFEKKLKWVVKVFKGSSLRHLQPQWPREYFQRWSKLRKHQLGLYRGYVALVAGGILLPNGDFAFVMLREEGDLRSLIDHNRLECGQGSGPFEKERMEIFIYCIASGMDFLHKRNIVHRDLKAANILVTNNLCCVADFECSIGVIGTGFWRDPQILQACKERNASQRPELFTRATDVYSFAMTCYEILTGNMPFEDELKIESIEERRNLVIEGKRPKVPEYVDQWIHELLHLCWHPIREERPTFEEILNIIVSNSSSTLIKSSHVWNMKVNNDQINLFLGCNQLSHGIEFLECVPYTNGVYTCKLCLKEGNGAAHHCSSCGDFGLHPKCGIIRMIIESVLHPHSMYLVISGFTLRFGQKKCGACQLEIREGIHVHSYKCLQKECEFYLHIHCAKYTRTISHESHEKHELVLMYTSTFVKVGQPSPLCSSCIIQLDPLEIVYSCRECGFNIHPNCILGELECKQW